MTRLLITAIVLVAFCAGCYNRVSVEDMNGYGTHVDLPREFRFSPPIHISQTESNVVVTVTFVKENGKLNLTN